MVVPHLIAALTPFLVVAIVVETAVAWRSGYRRTPKWLAANLALTALPQFGGVATRGALAVAMFAIHDRAVASPGAVASAVFALIAVDFVHYWRHRASHRVGVLWAIHAIHHQSAEFGYVAATRSHVIAEIVRVGCLLPLALFVSPWWLLLADQVSEIVDFFLHSENVRRLGPLEVVFNTPSHHRVHHGSNTAYLDKNHGAMLIIWDRMFGTFADETEPVRYGTVSPFESPDPVEAYLAPMRPLVHAFRSERGLARLTALLRPPEALPHVPSRAAPEVSVSPRGTLPPLLVALVAGGAFLSDPSSVHPALFALVALVLAAALRSLATRFERADTAKPYPAGAAAL